MQENDNEIDVSVEDERWEGVAPDLEAFIARAVEAALAVVPPGGPIEISVVLTDDPAVQELNRAWRGKDKPTNVLSFPNEQPHGGGPRLLGDVVLAYDTMLRESGEQSKPLGHHLAHLVVHGTLHLLGHDHELGDAEADAMEALEVEALRRLGVPDPYGDAAE
ncbi:rRNA maturation factor [Methylobacterium indicum]|uniref:Endoribonuclease YbeY n=1 Tax=Methylobacterium indicum TaxID=1775910 RepID=A0ABR5HG25_9HYPH|nr:rRNA maturation RNase YbeY [Methylobacterium indicum]KMO23499.1 rRNA maturation factor [Methylobacterium indicum]KMO25212.1 rRNA maturation factor [Methylobacterium indicum]KTS25644.1 rRNA maturation factor [Methylobacterium indicum]KTS41434.1 rRNA maturation factor [Methylobacterium indicum]KTS51786.1 rRNA maturation factor [Methylobacterium indicum]